MGVRTKSLSITGEIDDDTFEDFIEKFLKADATPGPITVYIRSSGGDVDSGTAIYELLRTSKNPVTTVGVGDVSSIATLIFLGGDRRVATEGTRFLFHDGSVSVNNSLLKAHQTLQEHVRAHEWAANQFATRTGTLVGVWLKRLEQEFYFGSDKALEWNLINEIRRYRQYKKKSSKRSKS